MTAVTACAGPKDGEYHLTLLTTNDVHGRYFDSTYVDGNVRKSLIGASRVIDSVRVAEGAKNVVLIDAGDCLQGDNAAYYFNYVDTLSPHVYPRMVAYMGYDALVWGNHDVETGHPVYDRVYAEAKALGVPVLAGNAIRNDNGEPYFPLCKIIRKGGLKVAILGYANPNIKAWLNESIWSGMHFDLVVDHVQEDVDRIRAKENPDVVIVAMHCATGKGDGSSPEAEGLDVFRSVRGVDFVVCSHDHRPFTEQNDTMALVNSGSHCRYVGVGKLALSIKDGKVVSKSISAGLIPVDPAQPDTVMRARFQKDYAKVKAFTLQEVGELKGGLVTREAYGGMSSYINLIHTLQLGCQPARISIAAPLTYDGSVRPGKLIYNDLFTIYPYENQLYVVNLTGLELRKVLEASYDNGIQNPSSGHILKIRERDDPRTGQRGWSFVERSYNFDSAGGLLYTVDVTKPVGQRVQIESFADGSPFSESETYPVAMTSYRANGGGGLLKAAGVDTDDIESRLVSHYPEIREILYDYLKEHRVIDPAVTGDPAVIGAWRFTPENIAAPALGQDLDLLFGDTPLPGGPVFVAKPLPDEVFERMQGKSYPKEARISREDLRYLQLSYYNFDGEVCVGEMVCNKSIARDLVQIFKKLYEAAYPIRSIRLVDDFDGDDGASMAADNTSCFNYRYVEGGRSLSRHARGLAVDINPLENPCVRNGVADPPAGAAYMDRKQDFPHKIGPGDLCHQLFTSRGFTWGGTWWNPKDYQHFEKIK